MSEMVRHKGIIKRLSNKDNLTKVYNKLVAEGKIEDQIDADFNEDGTLNYIYNDDYDVINGCLFDTSGAPEEYDADEEVADAERLNDTDYRIHIYYYNGGDSPIQEAIDEADKRYAKSDPAKWTNAENTKLRVTYENEETKDIRTIENNLEWWLSDDDGGSIGYEQGIHEIGREVYNDPESGWNYQPIKTEVIL